MTILLHDYVPHNPLHKERFAELNREWLTKYFRVEDYDNAVFNDPEGHILDKGGAILLAETSDGIVGVGSLIPMEKDVYEIAKMGVTEKCQAQGIGKKIFLALIERAKEKGAKKLFIVSNTSLEPAIKLYRRHGFSDSAENRHGHYERGDITLEYALE